MKEKAINISCIILKLLTMISGALLMYFVLMDMIFSESIYHANIVKSVVVYIVCRYIVKSMQKNNKQ